MTHIDAACVSMIGTTQPGRMADYIRRASKENDDGVIQRFGVLSWPDASPDWKNVDRWPDSNARERAWATFERLASLDPDSVDAQNDKFDALRFLRLDPTAQAAFDQWRGNLEKSVRTGDLGPALESHLSKYRKLVPSLALINHLADDGVGPIREASLLRALAAAEYFEAHARQLRRRPQCRGAGSEGDSGTHSQGRTEGRIQRARYLPRRMVRSVRQGDGAGRAGNA